MHYWSIDFEECFWDLVLIFLDIFVLIWTLVVEVEGEAF